MTLLQTIRRRGGIRESLTNIGWLSGDRVLRMLGAVIVGTAVARYLGPSQFGLLNYGLAIYGFFNIISNLGLDSLVVREIAIDDSEEPYVLGSAFILKGLASIATSIVAIIAARVLEPGNGSLIAIVALMSFASISQALDVIDYFFQAKTRSQYVVVPRNAVFIAASLARLAAIYFRASLIAFAIISALEVLLSEIGLLVFYLYARRPHFRWTWHRTKAAALLFESWPLLLSSFMIMLYMRSDQILLGRMASTAAVGEYTAAVRLSEVWYAIPIVICTSVMPRLLRSRENNVNLYYARLQKLYDSMVLISVAVAVATQLLGPLVVRLLYGRQFTPAAAILSVHIWTGVFVFVGCVSGQQLVQENLTVNSLHRTMLGAVVNIALNILFIPRWGAMGSAVATLVAQSIAAYFADGLDRRTRHIFRMKTSAYLRFWMLPRDLLASTRG